MDEKIRLFVAIELPEFVLDEVRRIRHSFNALNLFQGNWTKQEQLHGTLAFIGQVEQSAVDLINEQLDRIKFPVLTAQLSSLNYLTHHHRIKLIYLDFICDQLPQLVAQIRTALSAWITPEKNHQWLNHITLARIRHVEDREKLIDAIELFAVKPITFLIDSFVLKQSVLDTSGAIHLPIACYPLGG